MMGKRSPQARIFAADRFYLDYVGRDTLYGYLAEHREELFGDEDFAALYCPITDEPGKGPSRRGCSVWRDDQRWDS